MLPQKASKHIEESTLVAVPSKWPENFPYAVIEAQALGRLLSAAMGGLSNRLHTKEPVLPQMTPSPFRLRYLTSLKIDRWLSKSEYSLSAGRKVCHLDRHLHQKKNIPIKSEKSKLIDNRRLIRCLEIFIGLFSVYNSACRNDQRPSLSQATRSRPKMVQTAMSQRRLRRNRPALTCP